MCVARFYAYHVDTLSDFLKFTDVISATQYLCVKLYKSRPPTYPFFGTGPLVLTPNACIKICSNHNSFGTFPAAEPSFKLDMFPWQMGLLVHSWEY